MALKFKTRGSSEDALAQLMQLAQFSQQQKDRKQRNFALMQKELGEDIEGIYDNSQLDIRKNQFDTYYQANKDNMDEDTITRFELMEQKFNSQSDSNIHYVQGLERTKDIGREVEAALIDYSDINQNTELTEEKKNELRTEKMGKIQNMVEDYSTV